jgi:hypothetical protein
MVTKSTRISIVGSMVVIVCLSLPKLLDTYDVGGPSWSWKTFRADGAGFEAPEGWNVIDPFTTHTPYNHHLWYHHSPSQQTRIAYLSTQRRGTQVFLQIGDREELIKTVAEYQYKYDGHPLCTVKAQGILKTTDGHTVAYAIVRVAPGLIAGDDVTLVLGFAEIGEQALVINGGGLTARFDQDAVLNLIRSTRLTKAS